MRRTEQRQGLRMLKLRDVLSRWEAGSLSQLDAAELPGMSERTFRRWSRRFEEEGEDGLLAEVSRLGRGGRGNTLKMLKGHSEGRHYRGSAAAAILGGGWSGSSSLRW